MEEQTTVLVVDDEKVIREGCTLLLQPEGYSVATAASGREALDLMRIQPVDVVLCDLKMPGMGALEVLEEAGRLHPDVPIIIITGHGTVTDAVDCMKKGAYDFVTKPFRADHLTLAVKRALEKQRLKRETRRLQEEQARNLYTLAMEQSRMHTIVNCMADGVLVTNRNLEVVLCNPTFMRLLGLSPAAPPPGPLAAYLNDEPFLQALKDLAAAAEKEPARCLSQEICRGRVHLRAMTAPFFGPDMKMLGTVTIFHDVTAFKELDAMKNDFVQMVSHELRSPMTAIKLQHEVILQGLAGEVTDKQRQLLNRAQVKIQGLIDLINESLDIARIEAGYRQLELLPLQIGEVLQEVVDLLRVKAEDQKVTLQLSKSPDLPPVLADRRSMEEVFTNLVTNAINYSPDGGEIKVSAVSHGGYLEVQVSDRGIGIEPEEISKIFDKFYRVKHPRTRQIIGTGLGLALVKGIVDAHRGTVEVESRLGEGSTFRVFLPQ